MCIRDRALDLEIVRADAVQRRQRAHQHVIDAAELTGLLDDRYVLRFLDDANQALIARRARAERARIRFRDVVARRAIGDALLDVADGLAKAFRLVARILQNVKREAPVSYTHLRAHE